MPGGTGEIGKGVKNMHRFIDSLDLALTTFKKSFSLYKKNKYVTLTLVGCQAKHEFLLIDSEMETVRKRIGRRLRAIRMYRSRKKDKKGRFI